MLKNVAKTKTLRIVKMLNQKTKNAQKEMLVVKKQEKRELIVTKRTRAVAQALNNFFLKIIPQKSHNNVALFLIKQSE